MTTTPRHGITDLAEGQASPEVDVNENIRILEQCANTFIVTDRVTAPPGSPSDGQTYLIIATATGAFASKENRLALRVGTVWFYVTPIEGTRAYIQDEDLWLEYSGSVWIPAGRIPVTTQTGTSYTPALTDANSRIGLSNASPITLTMPQDSDVAFPIGTFIEFEQVGAGAVTVAAGTGATLRNRSGYETSAGQYAVFGVRKVAANTWSLTGDLA